MQSEWVTAAVLVGSAAAVAVVALMLSRRGAAWIGRHGVAFVVGVLLAFLAVAFPRYNALSLSAALVVLVVAIVRARRRRGRLPKAARQAPVRLAEPTPRERWLQTLFWSSQRVAVQAGLVLVDQEKTRLLHQINRRVAGTVADAVADNVASASFRRALDRSPVHVVHDGHVYLTPRPLSVEPTRTGARLFWEAVPGLDPAAYGAMAPRVALGFGVPEVRVSVDPTSGVVRLDLVVRDPLRESVSIEQFAAAHPGPSDPLGALPVAVGEDGEPVTVAFHHALVLGTSGSGKGSAIWAILRSLLPAQRRALVQFYGCDPKNAELRGMGSLFERLAHTPGDIAVLVAELRAEVERRAADESMGRSFVATPAAPALLLVIDEFTSLPRVMDRKEWSAVEADLVYVLSQGRSLGVAVLAAGQEFTKEAVKARDLFSGWRACLRAESASDAALVLGQGAVEAGAAPHLIAPATPANGYATAGTGYVQDATGVVRRCRFPYTSDLALERLAAEYDALRRAEVAP